MFKKLCQIQDLPCRNARFGVVQGTRVFLQLCFTVSLFGAAEAGDGTAYAEKALKACAQESSEAVSLVEKNPDGVYVGISGQRYLPVDLRSAKSARRLTGDGHETEDLEYLRHLKAIPAGPANRWGLVPAWIVEVREGSRFLVQAIRLERGEALFAPGLAGAACADLLRRAERSARAQKIGIWSDLGSSPLRATWRPKEFEGLTGHYVIARGRIVSLGKTRSTRYLNFGNFWKTDFTVTWKSADEESFDLALGRSGWSIDDLKGKTVEVRGVVQMRDGPLITLHHPEQLVVLENKRAARGGRNSN